MKPRCLLDMDGVLADFVGGICKVHNLPSPYLDSSSHGIWDTEVLWGMSATKFWKPANNLEFWINLSKTEEADALVSLVSGIFGETNVAILSAPSHDPNCIGGKMTWINKYYPQFQDRLIFGGAKEFLAGPGNYLIDDRDRNIDRFVEAGGIGIPVPRLWNRHHRKAHMALEVVETELKIRMGDYERKYTGM